MIDSHYSHIQATNSNNFSPLEPLQYWSDILTAGINPSQVKLIGIEGGKISAFEYRLALMLGASVALIKNSGRESKAIFSDLHWKNSPKLSQLTNKPSDLKRFINGDF
jgi:hypothetical protein